MFKYDDGVFFNPNLLGLNDNSLELGSLNPGHSVKHVGHALDGGDHHDGDGVGVGVGDGDGDGHDDRQKKM